jgi:hypothetical protein
MSQITLGSKTTLNLSTDLDPMFTDLYGVANYFQTPSYAASTPKLYLDSNFNLGLGNAPASASRKMFQIGAYGTIDDNGGTGIEINSNAVYNSGWKYIANAAASQYYQVTGTHVWLTATSGAAGAAITFTESMTLDASGNLLVSRSAQSSGGKFEVSGNVVLQPAAAAPTLGVNGDMSFQLVSNTSLKILVRGSDGVTRSTTLTLA